MGTRGFAARIVACLLVLAVARPAFADAVADVLSTLAKAPAFRAQFREERRIALLKRPLVSEGVLRYERPGTLVRRTDKPRVSELILAKGVLTVRDGARSQELRLSEHPPLLALVSLFVHVLDGDVAGLASAASTELTLKPSGGFRLLLRPRTAELAKLVRSVVLEGHGAVLESMDVEDVRGDHTHTTFMPLEPAPAVPAAP